MSSKQTAGRGKKSEARVAQQGPRVPEGQLPKHKQAHNTGLLLHTVLSMCIGTHGQKNIRLTGASIVFPGACWSPSTLIIHGHVHDGLGRQLRQQADRHRYGPALLSVKCVILLCFETFPPHASTQTYNHSQSLSPKHHIDFAIFTC